MYDERTCVCDEAAWLITAKTENGIEYAVFECHATEDQDSPNGVSWYFASHMKDKAGNWNEYDGGMYWDYENATDLKSVIGDTVPFKDFETRQILYTEFEDICFGQDTDKERQLLSEAGIKLPKEKPYNVKITEMLERTVTVKATNKDEALAKARDGYKREVHVLDSDDFKGVSFKVTTAERNQNVVR